MTQTLLIHFPLHHHPHRPHLMQFIQFFNRIKLHHLVGKLLINLILVHQFQFKFFLDLSLELMFYQRYILIYQPQSFHPINQLSTQHFH